MTRIIAGAAKGRRLAVPPRGTRPTADRAREGLFSSVAALLGRADGGGEDLRGLRMLDLYAGSGAVGLEALSRGASSVLLVERDRGAADVAARNAAEVGLDHVQVRRTAVESLAAGPNPDAPYDVVFADPPYDVPDESLRSVLTDLADQTWLAARALVVVERATRNGWAWPDGFDAVRDRRYGEATLWYGRAAG